MNKQEAGKVLAYMAAAFPNTQLAEDNAEVWYRSALERCEYGLGQRVAKQITETEQWFPTPARFNEIRRAFDRADDPEIKALPAGTEHPATMTRIKQLVAEAKARVAAVKGEHNHHGPNPCPVCGGVRPGAAK